MNNIETMQAEQILTIRMEAREAAYKAADKFFKEELGGVDQLSCGFAWMTLRLPCGGAIKGNTKLGRQLKKAGICQNYYKTFEVWNPSGYPCQNVDTLLEGARAAAAVFSNYGFKAGAGSRLD